MYNFNDMMSLRAIAVIAVFALAAACTPGAAAGGAQVRLLVFGAPEELAAYRTLKAAYESAVPGSKLELVEAADRKDLLTRLATSTAGGVPPDLFLMNYRFYGQFAAKNAIEPLTDRLAASNALRVEDFYPQAMDAFRWRGEQLCMPQNISSLAVYYNRDLFRKYGIAEPAPGWHWHDMVATAMALTRDINGNQVRGADVEVGPQPVAVHGLGIEPELIRVAPLIWSNGGELVDDPANPTRLTLDSPAAREALQAFLDLSVNNGAIPTDREVESEGNEPRFANGRLAMLISSRRSTTTFRSIKAFDWDVAQFPAFGTPANILHSDAYCITKGSKQKDAAWRFLEFALGAQGAKILAGTGRTVPSNMKVAQSPAFLDASLRPANAQVFLDAIPHIRAVPAVSTWPEIEDVTAGILENALYHGDPLDKVIAALDQKTRPIFARAVSP